MTLNTKEVYDRLSQKAPMQCVDKAIDFVPNKSCTGIKVVSSNEPFLQGHFPDNPIMPGVFIIESAAQTCALVMSSETGDLLPVLVEVEHFKLLKPIVPGDVMYIQCTKTDRGNLGLFIFDIIIKVNNTTCAKGSLIFTYIDKNKIYEEKA